jgi:ankyrin repeat protein
MIELKQPLLHSDKRLVLFDTNLCWPFVCSQNIPWQDENDWQPLHEAARAGNVDVMRLLLEIDGSQRRTIRLKVDINARTNDNRGCTALWLAEQNHGAESAASQVLRNNGGVSIGGVFADDSEQEDSHDNEDLNDNSEEDSMQDEY